MASNYTGDPSGAVLTLALPEDSDRPSAALFRVPYERLLDNDADADARATVLEFPPLIRMRALTVTGGTAITDSAESIGATRRSNSDYVVAAKTAQAMCLSDWGSTHVIGVPASITSLVTDAANDGSRILVIGTGGNRCSYSDDDGATWSAGGNISATPTRLIWNENESVFMATVGTSVKFSADGTSWTAATTSPGSEAAGGIACLSNGDAFTVISGISIKKSTDGGANWATTGSLPPGSSDTDGTSLAGNGGALIYAAVRNAAGSLITVSSSSGGLWTSLTTFAPPAGLTFTDRPRIMMCQNTGRLVVVAPAGTGCYAVYGSFDGEMWSDPLLTWCPNASSVDAFALAGGRLISTTDTFIFSSDGGS